ncbi:hypothetical protein CHCC15290_2209 [Bacillus licheniformis]|uniref:Uncharacterized protein n=1 Tax=Bacillus licheniformis TaxID=1402 RepID=A0A8B5YGF0_BACLI|nr:hypothetical protein B4090_0450 [Bacillus licheniformis]TWN08061.1 hypothetical protein CHCC14564_2573 [Bacillus licheniformis LMG 17339]KYC85905.1 hypothetical protein B4091_0387 [Bacillus licheniformis]OLF88595.1 hypothetical protein B4089_3354 [Bacillus licheniformis]OLG03029.1 hypothetical protein B4124_2357 [Bacillus licheniformis]
MKQNVKFAELSHSERYLEILPMLHTKKQAEFRLLHGF